MVVLPLTSILFRLFHKFKMNVEDLKTSNLIIHAYDDSKKLVIGTFKIVVTVREVESVVKFTILEIPPTFAIVLG